MSSPADTPLDELLLARITDTSLENGVQKMKDHKLGRNYDESVEHLLIYHPQYSLKIR